MEDKFAVFQRNLYDRYKSNGPPLYDPEDMQKFADQCSPGLYSTLLKSITRNDDRLSMKRQALQEKRTTSLLHTMAYFRYIVVSCQGIEYIH